ncbi:hypothetical protein [Pseudomonas baetica]|uniref:hypothetical protein n=1 Tax=Pseudomonas baetica TaxID=674054 RepID=UPI001FC97096|nr:hypothetical protein [Pseudomonas baetica]
MAADALATAFGNDAVLDAAAKIPVVSELTPTMQLKSVLQVESGLRLTTHSGEILLRTNKGNLQLVAVDEKWQQDNLTRLPKALAELAGQWRAKGVLTLQAKQVEAGSISTVARCSPAKASLPRTTLILSG